MMAGTSFNVSARCIAPAIIRLVTRPVVDTPTPIALKRGAVQDKPLERVLTAFQQNNGNAKVIILGEKDLQYHLLEQVLISCANAKITNVNFQTKPAGSGSVVASR